VIFVENLRSETGSNPPKVRCLVAVEREAVAPASSVAESTLPFVAGSAVASQLALPSNMMWLTYEQAAAYTGWSVRYLRNLVSADQIPVYGPSRSRRFRLDMLDLFLTKRDAAMRKFRQEIQAHHGD
jgi:excisionase family DNA binding protein